MTHVFADTSWLVALKDSSDPHHPQALAYLETEIEHGRTVWATSMYILSEVHAYFCRTPRIAVEYLEYILTNPLFHIVRATPADERQALAILKASDDKTYSWVDAVSFAMMDRLHITSACALDRHFLQHGRYHILPE